MARKHLSNLLSQVTLLALLLVIASKDARGLKVGFYEHSCPAAEVIVRNTIAGFFSKDPTISAPLLRLHFHDCFVRGCDGSVLLNSTKDNLAEKDAMPNRSLDAFYAIDAAKAALETACPGVVSCADIVALAARDAVSLSAGPSAKSLWDVPTGRRDARISLAFEALKNLPSPYADIDQLKALFKVKGLSARDLAILSGAHSIGSAHCSSFEKRLYNFSGNGDLDPSLNHNYAVKLRKICKLGDVNSTVEMVPGSSETFDIKYYKLLAKREGLFHSDAALLQEKETRELVFTMLHSTKASFLSMFGASMVNMGNIGVLTGNAGEIRSNCAMVNN